MTTRIKTITDPVEARVALTRKRGFEETVLPPRMREGIQRVFGADLTAHEVVARILSDIRAEGDRALLRYTEAFDGAAPDPIEVPRSEWETAYEQMDPILRDSLELSAAQIESFHRKQ